MEIELTNIQKQVDYMIDARIRRIARAAYDKANKLPNGRYRKKHKQYTLPLEVEQLLQLKQMLYSGENPEAIAAAITSGEINYKFLNS